MSIAAITFADLFFIILFDKITTYQPIEIT